MTTSLRALSINLLRARQALGHCHCPCPCHCHCPCPSLGVYHTARPGRTPLHHRRAHGCAPGVCAPSQPPLQLRYQHLRSCLLWPRQRMHREHTTCRHPPPAPALAPDRTRTPGYLCAPRPLPCQSQLQLHRCPAPARAMSVLRALLTRPSQPSTARTSPRRRHCRPLQQLQPCAHRCRCCRCCRQRVTTTGEPSSR